MSSNRTGRLKHIFNLYTSDLSYEEIERLIRQEASEVYEFFKKEIPKPDKSLNRFSRGIIFIRSLFNAFLLKLPPARRFFYFASLLFLIFGLLNSINGYIILPFVIINILLAFELADKLLVKNELEIAQKIQWELVPKAPPAIEGYEISFHYEPAKEVGGDYLDFVQSKESGSTYIIIGDVSGKGIAAALYVVRVQAIIHQLIESLTSLKGMIVDIRRYFSHNLRREFFLTLAVAEIKSGNSISLCRAGHNPVLYFNAASGQFEEIKPAGLAIGFNDKTVFEKVLEETSLTVNPGDIILFYTDGVTETMNESKLMFGIERVKQTIKEFSERNSEDIKLALLNRVWHFKGNAQISDDIAFVVMKVKK